MTEITVKVTLENDFGYERELTLPAKYEVCERCEGHGTILNPSIGEHAYSQEEFDEAFPDEEEGYGNPREEYFKRGGIYDITCPECNGKRVVATLDESYFTGTKAKQNLLKRIHAKWRRQAEYEAEERYWRRMESGGYDY